MTDEELLAQIAEHFKRADRHSDNWREKAMESYDFYAGVQWDEKDLTKLNEDQRPAVTFNRVARIVNAVVGSEINNRQETQFIPREVGDSGVNEVLTAGAEWARQESNAEDEESDAFQDMCICGMGWTETRMSYDDDLDGMIAEERIDPMEMYWDASAKKKNLSDSRFRMRMKRMDRNEFDKLWPDAEVDSSVAIWDKPGAEDINSGEHTYPQDAYRIGKNRDGATETDKVRVIQYQWLD